MSPAIPVILACGLGLIGWLAARSRAWTFKRQSPKKLHSLPAYHGWYVAIWTVAPALLFALVWSSVSTSLVDAEVLRSPAASQLPSFGFERETILAEARTVAQGNAFGTFNPLAGQFVDAYKAALARFGAIGIALTLVLGFAGGATAFMRLRPAL